MSINKKKVTFSELQDKFLGLSIRPTGGGEKSPASSKFENLDSSHFAFGVGIPESILIAGSMDYPPSCKGSCGSCSSTDVGSDGCEGCGCGSGGGGCGCSGGCGASSGGGSSE